MLYINEIEFFLHKNFHIPIFIRFFLISLNSVGTYGTAKFRDQSLNGVQYKPPLSIILDKNSLNWNTNP